MESRPMRWHNLGDLPDRTGNVDEEAVVDLALPASPRIYSHRQIDRLANGVARYLTDRGFARGTHIAILSFNRAEYVIADFGIMRAGCVVGHVTIKLVS